MRYTIRRPVGDLVADAAATGMRRSLGAGQLAALGVGAIVGAGVFSTIGIIAAEHAGPGAALAFVLAAAVAGLAGLAYAELASMIPLGGSGYTYVSAGMGELAGWLACWAIILSYGIGNSAVASSFSDNLTGLAGAAGWSIPAAWTTATGVTDSATGVVGLIDLPAFLVIALITIVLLRPVRESATANLVLVVVKVGILLLFVAAGATRVAPTNWSPFLPLGAAGIASGAAIAFFSFLGFDAVSTAAEETRDPQRDLPRGILGSLVAVTVLFVAVSLVLTGLVPSGTLNTGEPLAFALREVGLGPLAAAMNVAGILATLSVLLVFQLATTRVFMAASRDGLFPRWISALSRHQTPNRSTLVLGVVVGLGAAVFPLGILVEVSTAASLFLFAGVLLAVPLLRRSAPNASRPFRMPWSPVLPIAGAAACAWFILELTWAAQLGFVGWTGLGLMIYAAYGVRKSVLRRKLDAATALGEAARAGRARAVLDSEAPRP